MKTGDFGVSENCENSRILREFTKTRIKHANGALNSLELEFVDF
jgi:hypothetical protein